MADMHRPRGLAETFDIDRLAAADRRVAVSGAALQDRAQLRVPGRGVEADVQEAGPYRMYRKARAAVVAGHQFAAGQ
jgi:hypothetical protein